MKTTKRKIPAGVTEVQIGDKIYKVRPKPTIAKPHVDTLFGLFHAYINKTQQIARTVGVREPKVWQANMDKARAEFKVEMEKLGLADHLDWTPPEDEG